MTGRWTYAVTKTCLQCGQEFKRVKNARFCWKCVSAREQHSGRREAMTIVATAIRNWQLRPAHNFPCTDCGEPAREYDHRDYSKPLEVDPVCHRCNMRRGPGKWVQYTPLRELNAAA